MNRKTIGVAVAGVALLAGCGSTKTASSTTAASTPVVAAVTAAAAPTTAPATTVAPTTTVPQRQVTGKAVTLGAGTFTGGTDVAVGLYNVTPGAGQQGNFTVSGTDSYIEILGVSDGQGVPSIRAQISSGDSIQISGLSQVTFTPVTSPLITAYGPVTLGAGTWTVGQDIGAGRYVATPAAGQEGNFTVENEDVIEILGGPAADGGVPNVTVNLKKGDVIDISGISAVTMTPAS